jgi:type I restriction enzyme S subunit
LGGGSLSKLPEGWINVPLSDVARWGSGGTPSRANSAYYGGDIPWVKTGELGQGLIKDTEENITDLGLQNSSAKIFPKGSVLIAMYGATIGKTAILGVDAATNQACAVGIPREGITTTEYLFYYLSSQKDAFIEAGKGAAQPNISQKVIKDWTIPLASFDQQKRIADKLNSLLARVDACRDHLERIPCILERFRQSVLTAATSGKISEDWRDNRNQQAWQKALIGDLLVGKPRNGYSPRAVEFETDTRSLTLTATTSGRFNPTHIKYINEQIPKDSHLWLEPDDILIQRANTLEYVGVSAIYDGPPKGYIYPDLMMKCRANSRILTKFLYYLLSSNGVRSYFRANATGTTGNMPKINQQIVISAPVCVPPIDEQQEIVRRVEILFAYVDRIETHYQNALMKVERLTPVLLNKAFHGELVLQDPNDEPASVLLEKIQAEKVRMKSEQKTTRTVRRKTKEEPKVSVRQSLDDYVEALRSAFGTLGKQANARQLFDQAGFMPEEVVQFYEALRVAPEVRLAFEKLRQERPPRKQNSIAEGTDNQFSENARFRLIELWLEDFKNLADYTVRFDPSHSIDIVLGWNGTGKSNLFEALVIIFRDLYKWSEKNQWPDKPMKGYRLCYMIDEKIIEVSWQPGEMKRPKLKMGTLQEGKEEPDKFESLARDQLPLPRFIFGYYSGPTNRLAEHFLPMKQDHYNRLLDETSDDPEILINVLEKRRFFCAENHHAKYVLLAFFHKEDPAITQFLEDRLRIVGFESALFVIRQPRWAKKGQTAQNFWGARGVMGRVIERLRRFAIAPMVVEQTVSEGYTLRREDHYYFFLPDLQSLHAFAAEYQDARTFFIALESTEFSELIYDVKIQVRVQATKTERVAITFHELSEGEQQLLMVLGLMRFTKSHQSLVLLDEPDTHLNPHWSVDYLKLLTRVMSESSDESEEQQTSQILMSTHDPLVIASLFKEQIHLLKRDLQTGACKWEQPTVNPRGLGFTGILTSEMFGMRSDLDEETLADLDTKVRLVAKESSLTPEEATELEEINKRLEDAGFEQAFSDPYYAAFIRAWSRRYSDLMAGDRFLSPKQQEEIDRISREVLEEAIAELQAEAVDALG